MRLPKERALQYAAQGASLDGGSGEYERGIEVKRGVATSLENAKISNRHAFPRFEEYSCTGKERQTSAMAKKLMMSNIGNVPLRTLHEQEPFYVPLRVG